MKKIVLTLFVALFSVASFAQNANNNAATVVKFKELKYNFGKIKQGVPVTHDFEFTNVSNGPVIIENVTASCGCTTPTWPQAPVMKAKTEKIGAGFNAAVAAPFEKTIYVTIKGVAAPVELKIAGEVLTPADFDKQNKK